MNKRICDEATDIFRCILHQIHYEMGWNAGHSRSEIDEQLTAIRRGERRCGELLYTQPETSAQLVVSFPASTHKEAVRLLLDNPLDERLEYEEDGFVGRLGQAHHAIAQQHETCYITPISDPAVLVRGIIPVQYDEQILVRTLAEIDAIAAESASLHTKLDDVLTTYTDV